MGRILDRYIQGKVLSRWRKLAEEAQTTPLSLLRRQREHARTLRKHLDQVIHAADDRLTRPQIGSERFSKPIGTDWSWRPDLWRRPLARTGVASAPRKTRIDDQVTLFHDCRHSEIAVRQNRNGQERDLAPFSLSVEVFSFDGSFLSLSVEFPAEASRDLTGQHLFKMDALIDFERHAEIFARLNIQHGPNTEQVLRQLDMSGGESPLDFDLAHLSLNEKRIQKIWLDLIFDKPSMNRFVLRDLTICRHHRADF